MLLPKQIWKDISGYEGKYQVSNTGKVRSLNYQGTKGKVVRLKLYNNNHGYMMIELNKNGKKKKYSVHRLVALAFIPNPNNYPIINHKDENKTNNTVWNLEWCTPKYNINYGNCRKKISESHKGKQFTDEHRKNLSEACKGRYAGEKNPKAKPILMFTLDGDFIKRFEWIGAANEYLGKPKYYNSINRCLRGKSKTAYGYIWKYE